MPTTHIGEIGRKCASRILLILFYVFNSAQADVARLRFERGKDMTGVYSANALCSIVISKKNYDAGHCRVVISSVSKKIDLYFGPAQSHDEALHNATITTTDGKIYGAWSGPENGLRRPDYELGPLERDGDCWLNKAAKICVYGRVATSIGRCFLSVKGHAYIDGECPIESYTPLGEIYINDTCKAVSKYFVHLIVNRDGTGDGAWNGNPPTARADASLGNLKRQGACWENADARVCAYKGTIEDHTECRRTWIQTPEGHN